MRSLVAGGLGKEQIHRNALGAENLAAIDNPSAVNRTRYRARTQGDNRVVGLRAGAAANEPLGRDSAQLLLDVRRPEFAVKVDQQADGVEVHVDRERGRAASLRQPLLRLDPLEHCGAQSAEALRNGQPRVAAAFEAFVVFERERSLFVVARGALRKVVGQFPREIDETPLTLAV